MAFEDRKMKGDSRRTKDRFKEKLKGLWRGSGGLESSSADHEGPAGQHISDSQDVATGDIQEQQPESTADSRIADPITPPGPATRSHDPSKDTNYVQISGWDKIWTEAHKKVKEDPKDAKLLAKLELFLEKEEELTDERDDPAAADKFAQLKTIQGIAKQKLDAFEEARLSVTIGNKPIVVRESIIKAVEVLNSFKTMIGGAVATDPTAALAWAGISTVLPILENIFQQDENAATGLIEIIFLMTRYQKFHDDDFTSVLQQTSLSMESAEQFNQVKDELVSVYSDIYIYQARFILQYATRNKIHRSFRNALNADDWKTLLSEIQSKSRRIDDGVRDQIDVKTLDTWEKVKAIKMSTDRIESLQQDTLEVLQDLDRRQLLESLKITGDATFDSYETSRMADPCLSGTQLLMLKEIQDWAEDPDGTMIFWLEGMAGTGKTSISITASTALREGKPFTHQLDPPHRAFLGGSFFFKQGYDTRNSTRELFTTIARCLSEILPDHGHLIIKAIRENPGIDTQSSQQQFRKLIADPVALLDKTAFMPCQIVIVIDALDECDNLDARTLLGMLEILGSLRQLRLRLFITSRREDRIYTSLQRLPSQLYHTVRLEKVQVSPGEDNDITLYLSKTFEDLTKRYFPGDGGVSDADIKKLAEKADGLFIYAVTACRFLDDCDFASTEYRNLRLALIFENEDGPQQEVDSIYVKVLKLRNLNGKSDRYRARLCFDIGRLIGFIIVMLRPVSVDTLCHLLPANRADLDALFGHLHPILNIPNDAGIPVTLIHLSFRDFILDKERSKSLPFSVEEVSIHRDIFERCLEIMNHGLRYNICCLGLPGTLVSEVERTQVDAHIPQYLRYACVYWIGHLESIERQSLPQVGLRDDGEVHVFLQKRLLFWLEVMALIGEAPAIIPAISHLEGLIEPSENPGLLSLVHDAKRFIQRNRSMIELAPMQLYCSALLFCPRESKIRWHYQHLIPEWITLQPHIEELDKGELLRLEGHSDRINGFAFSPTEALIASVSNDSTTRVWDYITGSEKYRFHDPGIPKSVSFSRDGRKLASGCSDGTICLRDLTKATDTTISCQSGVVKVLFSPTATDILASLGDEGTLLIWNTNDTQQAPICYSCNRELSEQLAFSPDGQLIAARQNDYITVLDVTMAAVVCQFSIDWSTTIEAMAFSVDSKVLAVRESYTIHFWNIASSDPKLIESCEADFDHYSFLYLPASVGLRRDNSETLEFRFTSDGIAIGKFRQTVGGPFSHDGAWLADECINNRDIRILSNPYHLPLYKNGFGRDNLIFSKDDSVVLSWGAWTDTRRWNVADARMHILDRGSVRTITFSPCENFILLLLDEGGGFQLWNKALTRLQATFDTMASVAFGPGRDNLATLSQFGELQIFRLNSEMSIFSPIRNLRLEGVVFKELPFDSFQDGSTLHFSPRGEEAIVFFHSQSHEYIDMWSCQLWNLQNLEKNTKFNHGVSDGIPKVIFSPRNDFFIIESKESVLLYHLPSGELVSECDLNGQRLPTWHPVDHILAAASSNLSSIIIWEGLPWTKRFTFTGHEHLNVTKLVFSATNKIAAFLSSHEVSGNIIDIWDHITGQRVYSHALETSGLFASFNISPNGDYLETNRGRIPISYEHTNVDDLDRQRRLIDNYIYLMDRWIFQGYERLLWLPSAHRPETGFRAREVDIRKGTIALAQDNGSVIFIGVSLEGTPIAMKNMRINH